MKKIVYTAAVVLIAAGLAGCEKGKSCMCYEFDMETGHQVATGYYEDRASCSSTATWLGTYTDDTYFICDEINEDAVYEDSY